MKKLLLIPTVLTTMVLALSFFLPATASSVLRTSVQILAPGSTGNASAVGTTSAAGQWSRNVNTESSRTSVTSLGAASPILGPEHQIATSTHPNCGRFGDGMHGGKHDFTCPNRPFPAPAGPDNAG
jgi:hypothetical protein